MSKRPASRKWIIIPLLFVLFVAFGNLSSGINLLDRAIVVGLAIDGSADEIELSAQIVLPQNGGVSSGGGRFAVYESKGATLREAIEALSTTTGLRASFAHTDVIMFGTDFLRSGSGDVLEYIFKSELVRDTALLVAAPGEAKRLLKIKLPVNEVVSYHLIEMLQSNRDEAGQNPMTLQRYFFNYFTVGGAGYMPLVNVVKETEGSLTPDSGKAEDAYRLDLSKTVVMTREGYLMRLDREESKGLSYATKRLNSGALPYEEDGERKEAVILDTRFDYRAVAEDEVQLDLTLICRPAEKSHSQGGRQVGVPGEDAKAQIAGAVQSAVEQCFNVCRDEQCDVLGLGEVLYRKYGADFVRNDYLSRLKLDVRVSVFTK